MAPYNLLLVALLTLSARCASAAPLLNSRDDSADGETILSDSQTTPFVKPARLAQIAYCSPQSVLAKSCGPPCDAVPEIEPIVAGGDGGQIPRYFIAHDTVDNSIVVAHQGTESNNILSILNDVEFVLTPLDPQFFPNLPNSDIQVHSGFKATWERTADEILGNVTAQLQANNVNKVVVAGHSLGAALAVMDAVYLTQQLGGSASVSTTVFGLPRSGNQAWADFVDSTVQDKTHIHNKNDPVGRLPGTFLGFEQFSGEVHIVSNGTSVACAGQENPGPDCVDSDSILASSVADHIGPYYDNISMNAANCPA